MRQLFNKVRKAPKQLFAVVAVAAAVVTVPAALFAWGPSRPTYTVEKPANHVTFNSITNNPNIGDERNFVGIREKGTNALWSDNMKVQKDKEYTVRVYVHNNASSSLNKSGKGIAKDVMAKVNLPTTTGKSIQVDGEIDSSNASPKAVWDQATFTGSDDFNLSYVKGSLKYENNKGTFNLPESIFTNSGAKLGYDKMDGTIPGCFQYAGYVSFTVKPQFAPTDSFTMSKQVRKAGTTDWSKSVNANIGDTVDFMVSYKNDGEVRENNVLFQDMLPKGLSYVEGSTYLKNGTNPNGLKVSDNLTTKTGINVGDYNPAAAAYVKFSAKVDKDLKCGEQTLKNTARVTANGGYKEDNANVIVVNGKCETPTPKFTCDELDVQKLSRTDFKFSTAYTAENASYKSTEYVVRDSEGNELYRGPDATYSQAKAGDYTVQAYVTFTVDGQDKTVTNESCKKPFTVEKEVPGKIEVCDTDTNKIVKIDEDQFDNDRYTKDFSKCEKTPEVPGKMTVCEKRTNKIVTINENEFDSSLYTKDRSVCKETPATPETPTALPETGISDVIAKVAGAVSLTIAAAYYVMSRRNLS